LNEVEPMVFCRAALAFLVIGSVSGAHAQPSAGGDLATAEALFVEGKALSADARFAEACARFEASMALFKASMTLVPRLGVQLNLADCYERIGKTASAWVAFVEAAAVARRIGDERESLARQRHAALVPRLTRLRILISSPAPAGLVVTRDGVSVEPSVFGVAVPVDPGAHTVKVEAPERIPWSTEVITSGEGETATIAIPELQRRPESPAVAPPTPTGDGRRRPPRAFWITAGVGVLGIGAGTVLGISARSLWQQARADCDANNVCTDAAYALVEQSHLRGNLSTVAFAAGGAALVTSVVLYLRSPRDRGRPTHVVPQIAPRAAGVAVVGAF
jgi:hypothetical protein